MKTLKIRQFYKLNLGPVGLILTEYYIFPREWSINLDKGTHLYGRGCLIRIVRAHIQLGRYEIQSVNVTCIWY
jgi:hypothetical protein